MLSEKLQSIQALRGLAVIGVVLFHFHFWSYGYVGVDLFFAISGFVISASVSQVRNQNEEFSLQSLIGFFQRRIRRIYPPMLATISATLIIGIFQMTWINESQKKLVLQAADSILAVSNFYLYQASTNYFNSDIAHKPLLHLWSISVELQFYLVFGILLLFFSKIRVHSVTRFYALAVLIILSAWSNSNFGRYFWEKLGISNWDSFKFYSSSNRFWEFGYGILVYLFYDALQKRQVNHYLLTVLSACTLVIGLNSSVPLEVRLGVLTLPTIVFLSKHLKVLSRSTFLSSVGDRSYSIYLWHMPVIFFFYYSRESLFNLFLSLAILISLSQLTYKYLESNSLRREKKSARLWKNSKISFVSIIISSIIMTTGLVPSSVSGSLSRNPKSLHLGEAAWELPFGICEEGQIFNNLCYVRSSFPTPIRVVLGDSHAGTFVQAKGSSSTNLYFSKSLIFPGCSIVLASLSSNSKCSRFLFEAEKLLESQSLETLVFSEDYALYGSLYSKSTGDVNCTPYELCAVQGLMNSRYFEKLNSLLIELGKYEIETIIIIGAGPRLIGWPLQYNLWNVQFKGGIPIKAAIKTQSANRINLLLRKNLLRLNAKGTRVLFIDPTKFICNGHLRVCKVMTSAQDALFWDADHLSISGAQKIFENGKI